MYCGSLCLFVFVLSIHLIHSSSYIEDETKREILDYFSDFRSLFLTAVIKATFSSSVGSFPEHVANHD